MCEVCLVMCRLFVRERNTGLTVSNTEKNTGVVLGVRIRSREAADDQYSLIDRRATLSYSSKQESDLSKASQADDVELEVMYFPLDGQGLPPAVVCVLPIAKQRWST